MTNSSTHTDAYTCTFSVDAHADEKHPEDSELSFSVKVYDYVTHEVYGQTFEEGWGQYGKAVAFYRTKVRELEEKYGKDGKFEVIR